MKCLFTLTLILFLISALPAQQVINNILLPDSLGSMPDGAFSCVYNETNNCIYVGGQDFVFVLDGATDQKIARIPVTGSVTTMLWIPGENKIFCAHYNGAKVTVIDGASNSVITTVPVGVYPICLEYNATNNKVYCANKHSRDITVIDAASNSVITTMLFPDEARDMVWRAIGNTLWCVGGEWICTYNGDTNIPHLMYEFENSDFSALAWNATDNTIYYSDWANDKVNWNTMVGDKPTDLVWNTTSDKVYCANYGSDNVSVIDGVSNNVIATIPAGDEPAGLCWNSEDNKIYCLNSGSDDITIIDGVTDTVMTTVQVKSMSFDYSSPPLKPHLIINSLNDKLYFPQENEREVRIIDGTSNNILEDVRLGVSPTALVWNTASDKLYSINRARNSGSGGGGSISIIDGVNQAPLTTLTVGSHPSGVVWNSTNNTVYCANSGSDNVSVIDGISDQIIDTIAVGGLPNSILWNATSNKIYTANSVGNSVSIIDGATHTLLTTVPAGSNPRALTQNSTNNKIYCTNSNSSNVTVIDGFSNSVIATIPVGGGPESILWNATSNKIYTASYNNVYIIDGVMDTVITNFSTGDFEISNLTWNATNNKVYCGGEYEYIAIIDGESNQITNTILIESSYNMILDLFWNSLDNRLYCFALDTNVPSLSRPGKLFVIDGVTDSIITKLSLPDGSSSSVSYPPPRLFAADMQHNRIFLANFYDGSISVIDPTATGIIPGPLTKVPERFFLQQNYPNPFNPQTVISWQLAVGSQVKLTVYNVTGERVAILVNERQSAGPHSVTFDASHLASGVYLYRLETDQFVETRKMILMR